MCYSRYRRISLSNKDRSWTTSDEEQLVGLVEKVGEKWKLISMRMHSNSIYSQNSHPNRSENVTLTI